MGEHIGLMSRACQPVDSLQLLDEKLRERLRQQVPGWRIQADSAGAQCIRQEWTAKDAAAAAQLQAKLQEVGQQLGHPLAHADAIGSTVVAELSTPAKGAPLRSDACGTHTRVHAWRAAARSGLSLLHTAELCTPCPDCCRCRRPDRERLHRGGAHQRRRPERAAAETQGALLGVTSRWLCVCLGAGLCRAPVLLRLACRVSASATCKLSH